jgi:curved DNA-binding protein CbpA
LTAKDYYGLLGVERDATNEEIKKAYRRLALQYHPDRNGGDPSLEEKLKEVNQAYQVIGNEVKRHQYDLTLRRFSHNDAIYQEGPNDDLEKFLWSLGRERHGVRGFGGCRGRGAGMGGCKRRMWKF